MAENCSGARFAFRQPWATCGCAFLTALLEVCAGIAHAQSYPARAVRVVVPVTPGGGTDLVARMVSQKLSENIGQPFIIENRPGAGNVIGSAFVASSKPDGYTLLVVPISHAVNVSLVKLPFDPIADFAPVVHLGSAPSIVAVHPSLPVKSVGELVRLARSRPGDMGYGSGGNGSSTHLAAELLKLLARINLYHVPYKGGDPALVSVLSGQTSMCVGSLPSALPHVNSGRLKALAITSATRSPVLPALVTVAESGVPGYEYSGWYGLLAPAGTPAAAIERLNTEANKVLQDPAIVQKLAADGTQPAGGTPAHFADLIKTEIAKWAKVVKSANIRAE